MFNKLLLALGLAKGPGPFRRFVTTKALLGTLPALGLLGWRYRDRIADIVRHRQLGAWGGQAGTGSVAPFNT